MKNLEQFWSCYPFSEIFQSESLAIFAYEIWWNKIERQQNTYWDQEAKRWIYKYPDIPDQCDPAGHVVHYLIGSQVREDWETCKGVDLIPWGNPATARV